MFLLVMLINKTVTVVTYFTHAYQCSYLCVCVCGTAEIEGNIWHSAEVMIRDVLVSRASVSSQGAHLWGIQK